MAILSNWQGTLCDNASLMIDVVVVGLCDRLKVGLWMASKLLKLAHEQSVFSSQ